MNRIRFERIARQWPLLTADGFRSPAEPQFASKRREFLERAIYLQQTIDASSVLSQMGKAEQLSEWHRKFGQPESLKKLIEWHCLREVSIGAIIIAALDQGFEMDVAEQGSVSFNFLASQLRTELAEWREWRELSQVVNG